MKKALVLAILGVLTATPAHATVEKEYDPGLPMAATPWFGAVTPARRAADLNFITGMRPHHAGALTMADEYLGNPDASHPKVKALARGIIHNQTFEIGMLDTVEGYMKPKAGEQGATRQIASEGLAQRQKFQRAPVPARWRWGTAPDPKMSTEDVRFAKAMIVHHQAALDMANAYLRDPNSTNAYLRAMCLDILVDQKIEINFMNDMIASYPGNPDEVKIDASMVHGMDAMMHGGGAHGHHGMKH